MMPVCAIEPPEHGFYSKQLDVFGTLVKAHRDVADEALDAAGRRIERLLGSAQAVAANLASAGAEMHIIGRGQQVTELPMYRHMGGVPFDGSQTMDERARGYGGLHACCSEDSLLGLATARHRDHRDICSHEMAHTVLRYGVDEPIRARVAEQYSASKRRWKRAYAASNFHEFFAELTMWYVGSRGDFTSLRAPAAGPEWLEHHDPESYALLNSIYEGRLKPRRITWAHLEPCGASASVSADEVVTIMFVNETDRQLERFWLSYAGERRPYGPIAAGSVAGQPTFVTHPWALADADGEIGVFVAEQGGHAMVRVTDGTLANRG